eukprot:TRINITY_DN17839_c0_g2_i2.p1 TRINITY_DN17839_c0_g2~~TRINITY_DN17839_c0_g2_i2.p1  ORF type:complete len:1769 (+),score=548.01 TRINITY_DN17839_c0_g2_i2:197-5308(+)
MPLSNTTEPCMKPQRPASPVLPLPPPAAAARQPPLHPTPHSAASTPASAGLGPAAPTPHGSSSWREHTPPREGSGSDVEHAQSQPPSLRGPFATPLSGDLRPTLAPSNLTVAHPDPLPSPADGEMQRSTSVSTVPASANLGMLSGGVGQAAEQKCAGGLILATAAAQAQQGKISPPQRSDCSAAAAAALRVPPPPDCHHPLRRVGSRQGSTHQVPRPTQRGAYATPGGTPPVDCTPSGSPLMSRGDSGVFDKHDTGQGDSEHHRPEPGRMVHQPRELRTPAGGLSPIMPASHWSGAEDAEGKGHHDIPRRASTAGTPIDDGRALTQPETSFANSRHMEQAASWSGAHITRRTHSPRVSGVRSPHDLGPRADTASYDARTHRRSSGPLEAAKDRGSTANSPQQQNTRLSGAHRTRPPPGVPSLSAVNSPRPSPSFATSQVDASPTVLSARSPTHGTERIGGVAAARTMRIDHTGHKVDMTLRAGQDESGKSAKPPAHSLGKDRVTQCRVTVRKAGAETPRLPPTDAGGDGEGTGANLASSRNDGSSQAPMSGPSQHGTEPGKPEVRREMQQIATLAHDRRTHNITSLWKRPNSRHIRKHVSGHHHSRPPLAPVPASAPAAAALTATTDSTMTKDQLTLEPQTSSATVLRGARRCSEATQPCGVGPTADPGITPYDETQQQRADSVSPVSDQETDCGGTTSSVDSYDIDVDYEEPPTTQTAFEAVWLPCMTSTFANVSFLQLPLAVARLGLGATLLLLLVAYASAGLTWASVCALLHMPQPDAHDGPYQLLSRQLGSEFGGAVGMLYWLVFVVFLTLHAHGVADVVYHALEVYDAELLSPWAGQLLIALIIQLFVGACTYRGVQHVSLVEAAGVSLAGVALICTAIGCLLDWQGSLKPGGVSGGRLADMWFPDENHSSYEEGTDVFCRIFPLTLGVLSPLGRPTDLERPALTLPWATAQAFALCFVLCVCYCILVAAAMDRKYRPHPAPVTAESGVVFVVQMAVPARLFAEAIISLAIFMQCVQAMLLAPRVLQAIAQDHVVPLFTRLQNVVDGEPRNALVVTLVLSSLMVPLHNLLYASATVIILCCFVLINVATALNSIVETPQWRPTFRLFEIWNTPVSVRVVYVSVAGMLLSLFSVFAIKWWMALVAMLLIFSLAKYLEYRSDFTSWGDGNRGLQLQQALEKLLSLEGARTASKNWRPQLLVLVRLTQSGHPAHERLLSVADQLKMGKGLNIIAAVIVGNVVEKSIELHEARNLLTERLSSLSIRGFCSVIASPNFVDGCTFFMQEAGLGPLRPNTVLLSWPTHWKGDVKHDKDGALNRKDHREKKAAAASDFSKLLQMAYETSKAVLVIKGVDTFPCETDELCVLAETPELAAGEHIDLWWIVADGSMELMIAFLLRQHAVWKKAQLRIFSICDDDDDTDQIAERLSEELARLKIDALLIVQPVDPSWLEEFHRTGEDEADRRHRVMDELQLTKMERHHDVDEIVDNVHKSKNTGSPRATSAQGSVPPSSVQSPQSQYGSYEPVSQRWGTGSQGVPDDKIPAGRQSSVPTRRAPSTEVSGPQVCTTGASSRVAFEFQQIHQLHRQGSVHSTTSVHIDGFETVNELRGAGPQRLAVRGKMTRHSQHFECLNQLIREHSEQRDLTIITLPDPVIWKDDHLERGIDSDEYALEFMEDMERLLHGLQRVIMIRGSGEEIITNYW